MTNLPDLTPAPVLARRRARRRCHRVLAVAIPLTAVMLAGTAACEWAKRSIRSSLGADPVELQTLIDESSARSDDLTRRVAAARTSITLADAAGAQPDWSILLAALTHAAEPHAKLTSLNLTAPNDAHTISELTLGGHANAARDVSVLAESLAALDPLTDVTVIDLARTPRGDVRFTLRADLAAPKNNRSEVARVPE